MQALSLRYFGFYRAHTLVRPYGVLGLDNAGIVPTVIWFCCGRTVAHPYGVLSFVGLMPASTTNCLNTYVLCLGV
jgi:hypothetical protein